jgi:hypothetical protein
MGVKLPAVERLLAARQRMEWQIPIGSASFYGASNYQIRPSRHFSTRVAKGALMYVQPTAPRSVGGVLDDSLRLYKASFAYAWPGGLVLAIVGLGFALYTARTLGIHRTPAQAMAMMRAPTFWGGYLVTGLISVWVYCAMIANIIAVGRGQTPNVSSGFAAAVTVLPAAIVGAIVLGLSTVVGTALLIIPGIYIWNRMQLWIVALMAERQGAFASVGSSWNLVGGNWWRTFITISVMVIVLVVIVFAISLIGGVLTAALHLDVGTRLMVTQCINAVWYVFALPLLPVALVAIYQDLKLRKEGGDLAARVGKLQF